MRDNPSAEKDKLSTVEAIRSEMSGHVRNLARPSEPGESVKACVRRVSMHTGLSFGQVRRLWYGEWRRVPTDISDKIRKAVECHERRNDQAIAARKEREATFWALTHQSSDPVFYRERAACGEQLDAEMGDED